MTTVEFVAGAYLVALLVAVALALVPLFAAEVSEERDRRADDEEVVHESWCGGGLTGTCRDCDRREVSR